MPRIAIIGTGYVGLVSGACFSEWGFPVTCVDSNAEKIATLQRGGIPIYESGLEEMVRRNSAKGHLRFTTDLKQAVRGADVVFLAVGTPMGKDGHADLTYVYAAAESVAKAATGPLVMLTKSTVPIGTTRDIAQKVKEWNAGVAIEVASNPEFLREGSAIKDFMKADRVIVGTESERVRQVMTELYQPLTKLGVPVFVTDPMSAELIKYAANGFLATKVAFINEMADICEKVGANIEDVSRGIGLDQRIGKRFLKAGPGFGGSCFPKDTQALAATASSAGAPTRIVESVIDANEQRKIAMAKKVIAAAGGSVRGKKIGVLGLTFKPDTDDMRDSASLVIVPELLNAGATISAYDPAGMEQAKAMLPSTVTYGKDMYAALDAVDVAVIITEWEQFKALNFTRMAEVMRVPLLVDLRNIFRPRELEGTNMHYVSIGRPPAGADIAQQIESLNV